jgi:hypothetical protein
MTNTTQTDFKKAEDALRAVSFAKVEIPDVSLIYARLEKPVPSPYMRFNFSSLERKVVGFIMAIPVAAAVFAFIFSINNQANGVYLASNDVAGLEQANVRILSNINDLENLSK